MIRKINNDTFLYLCQSSDWQCIIEAKDEEEAATIAVENLMEDTENSYTLAMLIGVKKLCNNLFEGDAALLIEPELFYSPLILANAGYHSESKALHEIVETEIAKEKLNVKL